MKLSWFIWALVSALLGLYLSAGYIASHAGVVDLKLERGTTAEVKLLRIAESNLRMEIQFKGDRSRSELGSWETLSDWTRTGSLIFAKPGAAIRLAATLPSGAPVIYEAMPASAFGHNFVSRNLTSDVSIQLGVWRWPPENRDIVLEPGFSTIRIEVISVDAPLSGESVQLIVRPPLGLKVADLNVHWLFGWFFWPFLVLFQVAWACLLATVQARKGRKSTS